ncbi:hypothetical protein HZH66_006554 [Vespula vulgaris]|uniref:Uncharacterized protein n=1 Tax=Vespula vulgaris TaxID=7454 RepID=A0A834N734_VESVU|nr:hypothetical protein HZH66_006554 [Vespula vulgaris]
MREAIPMSCRRGLQLIKQKLSTAMPSYMRQAAGETIDRKQCAKARLARPGDRMDSLEYKIFGVGFSTLNELNRRANADPYKSLLEHERTVGGLSSEEMEDLVYGNTCFLNVGIYVKNARDSSSETFEK